ncbi:hypothetical protein NO559_04665 [Dasania sp. GY-MA-18]|uniref:TonB C-terminal domain-containing protein n=1 Tax=Dasania phycosphaerae TaxID=2950436 RepID=A0A9J6RIH0_9GAMM|nr:MULTISPECIES: hypothetical protein [Dasania]MCR8922050.1 hypothetical protein [Dasania sp. GY-MA-18]MCZ0864478.1 hypothetical protein [Dasania phycosphaerae]MCZ0868206.1 hypothetical protein [Dasania phycosphaerae]
MKDLTTRLIIIVLFFTASTAAYCEATSATDAVVYLPARFADGGNSLLDALTFKTDQSDFIATTFCYAKASIKGKLIKPLCLISDWEQRAFSKDVELQLNDLPIVAATINGEPVNVQVQMMVSYQCGKGRCQGLVTLNHGELKNTYGLNYIAPQLILDGLKGPRGVGGWFFERGVKLSLGVTVDSQGLPIDVKEFKSEPEYRMWSKKVKKMLKRSRYIPGIYNAEYVSMSYTYAFIVY